MAVGFATHERTVDWTWSPMSIQHPATWTDGEFQLLGTGRGAAWGTNDDGSFVVGELDGRAVLWERGSGARFLETLEPAGGYGMFTGFRAVEVSDDGSTARVLQVMSDFVLGEIQMHPQLWRQGAGAVRPRDLLAALGAEWPDGNLGVEFVFLGPDGRTLVGFSSSTPQGEPTGALWRALLPPAAEYYCTTQASSGGCAPRMAFTGTPSARTGAGFTIRVRDVPAGAFGVLAYGTSGAASVPFEGGTLCVAEPTTRVALGTAGGAGTCDGTLAVDFNAVVVAAGDPELVGGAAVWTQVWLRETGPQPARIASDALMFTLWP